MAGIKPITPGQIKIVQTLFSKIGFDKEDRRAVISQLTGNRASSTKDITFGEAKYLIAYLKGEIKPPKESKELHYKIFNQIYYYSYLSGICYGDTEEDRLMNIAKINKFCKERGTVKKELSEMTLFEMKRTLKQFISIWERIQESAVKRLVTKQLNIKIEDEGISIKR